MDFLWTLTGYDKKVDSFTSVLDDLSRRYAGTYMFLTVKSTRELVYIPRIPGDGISVLKENMTNSVTIPFSQIENLEIFMPVVGYYQLNNKCYYLERRVKRQYKRSFCNDLYVFPDNFPVYALKDPNTFIKNLDLLDEDSPNVALNRHFAVIYNHIKKKSFLYYRGEPIGHIKFNKKTIIVLYKELLQEATDLINRLGCGTWKTSIK